MNYNLEIQKLLLQIEKLNNSADKINLLKQAIKLADTNNDIDWGFDLRLDLISEEKNTSKCIDSFIAFSWILDAYDKNPDLFDEDDFLWEYKWMISSSYRNVNISKEQIQNITNDLKVRLKRNGYSLRGYYSPVIDWKLSFGELGEAEKLLKLRDAEEYDNMSHCEACELDTSVEIQLEKGNFDEAIHLAHDLITKKKSCVHVPWITFCDFTYFLGKKNDDRAEEYFLKAEEELNNMNEKDSFAISSVSKLINYLSFRDREKAWKYFETYSEGQIDAEDYLSFVFSMNILKLLSKDETIKLNLNTKIPYFKESGEYNSKDLYNYYFNVASDLAEKFDMRNNNSYCKDSLNKEISTFQ